MSFSGRLRERRRACGLTQGQLADAIQISTMTVRRWENEERFPNTEMLRTLASKLKTTTAYLLEESNNPEPAEAAPMAVNNVHNVTGIQNNSNTGDNTVNVNTPSPSRAGKTGRWWLRTLQEAYDTADGGDQQQISDALAAIRQSATVLERAQTASEGNYA